MGIREIIPIKITQEDLAVKNVIKNKETNRVDGWTRWQFVMIYKILSMHTLYEKRIRSKLIMIKNKTNKTRKCRPHLQDQQTYVVQSHYSMDTDREVPTQIPGQTCLHSPA